MIYNPSGPPSPSFGLAVGVKQRRPSPSSPIHLNIRVLQLPVSCDDKPRSSTATSQCHSTFLYNNTHLDPSWRNHTHHTRLQRPLRAPPTLNYSSHRSHRTVSTLLRITMTLMCLLMNHIDLHRLPCHKCSSIHKTCNMTCTMAIRTTSSSYRTVKAHKIRLLHRHLAARARKIVLEETTDFEKLATRVQSEKSR